MPEEIFIDTETWGTRELLEVISSRFFELGNEGSYPNSWEVRGLDGKDVSEQLEEHNGIGWITRRDESPCSDHIKDSSRKQCDGKLPEFADVGSHVSFPNHGWITLGF